MAVRGSQKLFSKFNKSLNTSATRIITSEPSINLIEKQFSDKYIDEKQKIREEEILDFNDGNKLFSSVPTSYLLKSMMAQSLASYDPVVDIGVWVMKSKLVETMIIKEVIMKVLKYTFYDHFCAGENLEEANQTLQKLWNVGLRGIMDYGLEDAIDNDSCDRNLNEFYKTVESTKLLPPSSVSYACVKISAICPISLLRRVSDLLRWEHQNPSFKLPWKLETLPILSDSSPFYHTLNKPEPLTQTEENDLLLAHQRILKLSQKCLEINLPLLVDAEYTSVQPAIDYLTYTTMIEINRYENPIVYGTIQAYLKDAKDRLIQATQVAEKMGVKIGVKLVRGAYLSSEQQLSSSLGFSSPIHDSIQETHDCYNECASIMLEKAAKNVGGVLLATHNIASGRKATAKVEELGIKKSNEKVQFAQLKGMADGYSLALKNAGFQVSKYLPYGPVEMVIPYLLRRAEENRGVLSASTLDRQLIKKEVMRRLKTSGFTTSS